MTPIRDSCVALVFAGAAFAATASAADRMPLLMPDDFESLKLVSWRVEEGVPDPRNPLLEPAMPWDSGGVMAHGTVLRDPIDGLWKAWQVSTPAEEAPPEGRAAAKPDPADPPRVEALAFRHVTQRRLTYLESKDGVNWYRPMLPFVGWPGHDRTNILLDLDSGGTAVYASVFVDPENKEWPYEMFVMRSPKKGNVVNRVGSLPGPQHHALGCYRYRSKDGKDWKLVDGPLMPTPRGDVCYVYRQPDGSYISYFKINGEVSDENRIIPYDNDTLTIRKVARRTSADGREWGNQVTVLSPDWRDPDFTQFLELCPVKVEGGYMALVNYYNPSIQTMSLQLAASRDGIHWWRPDRRPALANPPLGDYGGGMIWQMHHPVVEDGRMHVYYAGSEGLHGEIFDTRFGPRIEVGGESVIGIETPTLAFNTALCRATWQFDRLWALAPSAGGATFGEAVTRPGNPVGSRLAVNLLVRDGGEFRAELLDKSDRPVPGFSVEDCHPITGDHRHTTVSWKGGEKAPAEAVKIRFVLQRAFLYGYDWGSQ